MPSVTKILPAFGYQDIKSDETEKIINRFLVASPSSDHPILVHMLGIPGAGKSTFYRNHHSRFADYVFVSFDEIMEALPAYQSDLQKLGSVAAFSRWELPARVIGYELLSRAIAAKKNIFLDHGGSPLAHQELLQNIKALNYQTEMFWIKCDLDKAIRRTSERAKITKRHTPPQMIVERQELIRALAPRYKKIVDKFHIIAG